MTVDLRGFDTLKRKLDEVEQNGSAGVQLNDLFNADFMMQYTSFASIDEMVNASGVTIRLLEDFNNIPESFMNSNTQFANWKEMLQAAIAKWTGRNLGLR